MSRLSRAHGIRTHAHVHNRHVIERNRDFQHGGIFFKTAHLFGKNSFALNGNKIIAGRKRTFKQNARRIAGIVLRLVGSEAQRRFEVAVPKNGSRTGYKKGIFGFCNFTVSIGSA